MGVVVVVTDYETEQHCRCLTISHNDKTGNDIRHQ